MQEEVKPTVQKEAKPTSSPVRWGIMVAVIIIVLAALAASTYIGYKCGYKKAEQETKTKYEEAVTPFIPFMPEEITSFSGTVEKIEGKTLYVRGAKPTAEILEMAQEITMKMLVTDATKIFKLTMIPPEEIAPPKEGGEFVPPEPFKRTEMKFEDIKVGMSISATARENIIGKEEFEAVEIQITGML
jgi:hypothetical protein